MTPEIHIDRVMGELETLATFSDTPAPAVTRVVFSPPDREARRWLKGLCMEAGLTIREDAIGNLFARWEGLAPELPAVSSGSHIDAIPHAGKYDGTVGVLGALEAIRALQRAGYRPRRSIELVMFTSEEPTRFGIGCLGSRLLSGALNAERAAALRDSEGAELDEVRSAAGFSGPLASVVLPRNYYHAFVELHIEQGPLLEKLGIPLGIVRAIAAPATLLVEIEGDGGHAGAVLMPERHDAFLAAAELALAVETAAQTTGSTDSVATVGLCEIFPGAVNSIPSRVRMVADVRDIDLSRRDGMLDTIRHRAQEITEVRGVRIATEVWNADPPAQTDVTVVDALRSAAEQTPVPYQEMISRAYHDSLFMARIVPSGMLFIPCRGGVSHRPDESVEPEDLKRGINTLAGALVRLST
jgi:N-carbamoyl-L-amino-acid hydrolase